MIYNFDYYERGVALGISGYSNYRWIPELTIPMCARIIEILGIKDEDRILDFGCAKGYMVYAFRLLHKQCWGYDISEYAVSSAPDIIKKYIMNTNTEIKEKGKFDLTIAKDVFEHIPYDQIESIIYMLANISHKVFAIVPMGENDKYIIPSYENDITHVIRKDLEWWKNIFKKNEFTIIEAVHNMKYIKENYEQYEKGNGFFILQSKIC